MKMEEKIKFNLSPSSLNLFFESPLLFYYTYIEKAQPDTEVPDAYSSGGTLVHKILELYADGVKEASKNFETMWETYHMEQKTTMNGRPLPKSDYMKATTNGVRLLENRYNITKTENKYTFPFINNDKIEINLKGYVDGEGKIIETGENIILDWKTSSNVEQGEAFRRQGLFYTFMHMKSNPHLDVIPMMVFEYVKINERKVYHFTKKELEEFEKLLYDIAKQIKEYGRDKTKYPIGDITSPFNCHAKKCAEEVMRRQEVKKNTIQFRLVITNGRVVIQNKLSERLKKGLKAAFSYEVQNSYFIKQNSNWDGIQRLYNESKQSVALGFFDRLLDVLKQYCQLMRLEFDYSVNDTRPTKPIELADFPSQISGKILRDYQEDAVKKALEKKIGILQLPTSAGKTEIAMEFIRRHKLRTLFVVNRKELMYQTKERMEKAYNNRVDIGVVGDGQLNTEWITVATIQSLLAKKSQLWSLFQNVQCIICDETHIVASKSFRQLFAMLPNTLYRIGISATPKRDDGDDMLIQEGVGKVIYKISPHELMEKGYIMKPTIYFHHVGGDKSYTQYPEDYEMNIVLNDERNKKIFEIVKENKGKKILILTKQVGHGKYLSENIEGCFHLHGSVDKKTREKEFNAFKDGKGTIMVATMSIASEGLNIPDLDLMINSGANAGDVKSIQILGRVMRVFEGKEKAIYHDFVDKGNHTTHHSRARMKLFKNESYDIVVK